jgi:hypothetical protein
VLSSGTSGGAPLQQQQHVHLFIGNEAADPDSIISSLCSAFLFHSQQQTEAVAAVGTGAVTGTGDGAATCMTCVAVPMCCIPRADLVLRRDTQLLFRYVQHLMAYGLCRVPRFHHPLTPLYCPCAAQDGWPGHQRPRLSRRHY